MRLVLGVASPPVDALGQWFFLMSALMFGSTPAVYAFNRLSKSLWHLQTCLLSIMGTLYYDDFPMLELRSTAGSARECSEQLLRLLGRQFAEEGRKALPFDEVFTVLGINVDLNLQQARESAIFDSRSQWMAFVTRAVLNLEKRHHCMVSWNLLRVNTLGRNSNQWCICFLLLLWQDGMILGRTELSDNSFLSGVLATASSKVIDTGEELRPILFFSDGAWEPNSASPDCAGRWSGVFNEVCASSGYPWQEFWQLE